MNDGITVSSQPAPVVVAGPAAWWMAARPKTLTAAIVPVLVGTAVAYALGGMVDPWLALAALVSALFIQVGTNFVNDAIDFRKGADTHERVGPRRVTQSGIFTERQVLAAGLLCFGLATLAAIPLVIAGGWTIVAIGVASLLCGYIYTGGPFPLAYRGLGDLFVVVFFGLIAVAGTAFLQLHRFDTAAWVAGAQIGLLATALIAINNLRDREGDARVGKRTLAVRLGVQGARWEIGALLLLPPLLGHYWREQGFLAAAFLPLGVLPSAFRLARSVFRTEPGPKYNFFLAHAAAVHFLFGVLLTVGLLVDVLLFRAA